MVPGVNAGVKQRLSGKDAISELSVIKLLTPM
jgi:hypothetical protein